MNSKQIKWLVGAAIILLAGSIVYTLNMGDGLVLFFTPSEAYAKGVNIEKRTVRIAGMVKPETKEWDSKTLKLNFTLTDFKGHNYAVYHTGSPPDLFKENQGVIVEGVVDNTQKTIRSKKLLVKHSEEYRVPTDESFDKEMLQKSIFKD